MPKTEILMATYNNAAFLSEMLQSLVEQEYDDFHLIVSDDASNDTSLDIVEAFAPKFKNPVRIIPRKVGSGSAKANFASLMKISDADFVLWADADDVWLPHKVGQAVQLLTQLDEEHGVEEPLYMFTDVEAVDVNLKSISESYWGFKKIDPEISKSLSRMLVCPPMLGCASAANRALIERARDVPINDVTGHDWWAILVASVFGKVFYSPQPSMKYRLHGGNSSAPKKVSVSSYAKVKSPAYEVRRRLDIRRRQAKALIDVFANELPPNKRRVVERFLATESQGFFHRRITLYFGRYIYPDFIRNIAVFIFA